MQENYNCVAFYRNKKKINEIIHFKCSKKKRGKMEKMEQSKALLDVTKEELPRKTLNQNTCDTEIIYKYGIIFQNGYIYDASKKSRNRTKY